MVAGDFNTRHLCWDRLAKTSKLSEKLVEWTKNNSLQLVSLADYSTHTRGSTLDLVFTDILGTQSNIERHLYTILHHETPLFIVLLGGNRSPESQRRFRLTEEAAPRFAAGFKETISAQALPQDLDQLVELIIGSVQINIALFLPPKMKQEQVTKWRNQDCREKETA